MVCLPCDAFLSPHLLVISMLPVPLDIPNTVANHNKRLYVITMFIAGQKLHAKQIGMSLTIVPCVLRMRDSCAF